MKAGCSKENFTPCMIGMEAFYLTRSLLPKRFINFSLAPWPPPAFLSSSKVSAYLNSFFKGEPLAHMSQILI